MPLIRNFGRNVAFRPAILVEPRTEEEVLEILHEHSGKDIRCRGALHSWSRIAETTDVLMDLRHFDRVEIVARGGGGEEKAARIRVGAGCTIRRILDCLEPHGLTLPTLGAVTRQTIAGAIATGTHGSGKSSLSHFVEEVRLATYDAGGRPVIRRVNGHDDLLAARCALGGLGVMLEVVLRARAAYRIEEEFVCVRDPGEAIAGRAEWPLQQFFVMPWKWRYYIYRRRPARKEAKLRRWRAFWRRLVLLLVIDVGQHALLKCLTLPLAWLLGDWVIRFFLRATPITQYKRLDDSRHVLTLRHDLFRHVEMEVFVPQSELEPAIASVRELIEAADRTGLWTHHYPVSFRYVLPDDTLLSMASGDAPWVAISFFNYRRADSPDFQRFAAGVAAHFVEKYGARLHWGKYFPRDFQQERQRYPGCQRFDSVRDRYDPTKVFRITNL
jgi:L-gulono-1,4-lactone dehydrogenase